MYREATSKQPSLEYHDAEPRSPPKKYARHGILATTLLLGLTLLLTTWFSWRDTISLADTVSEGQGELYLRAMHDLGGGRSPEHAFRAVVEMYDEHGLRAAGYFDADGAFRVMAGEFFEPIPNSHDRRPGRFLTRIGERYRLLVHLPPNRPPPHPHGPRKPPPHDGPPFPPPFDHALPPDAAAQMDFVAFEFEPVLATGLAQRARMTFLLATGVAALLAIAAIVLWRKAGREDAMGTRLAHAERLASLGTMSAVLAHEIKNPLASLKGNAQLVAESLSTDSRSRMQADRVVDAAMRLQILVQNLLDFARGGPIERTEVDPAELLFLAAEDAAPSATLELDHAPATWSLDAVRMRQVLENLLRNAVQSSPDAKVQARVFMDQDDLVYIVEDDGPGFPSETLENVFEPFYTTKSRGIGLGLAVARRIISMHGGVISAKNKAEGGAEVKVSIPKARRREQSIHGADSSGG